jgi:adenylosuccinate synthase
MVHAPAGAAEVARDTDVKDTEQAAKRQRVEEAATQPNKLLASTEANQKLIANRHAVWEGIKDIERIPELDYKPTGRYVESSKEKVLHPLIENNQVLIVAGAFFGDEGKGKTVDAIAGHPLVKVVARVNSGENAGHTVVTEAGIEYHFHLCPSGVLTPGKVNCVGPECVMDPVSFMKKEISQLTQNGVPYKDSLFIGNCHLVCPHHKLLDLMSAWSSPNMSTLQGMAPVHSSKAKRRGLRMDHIFQERDVAAKWLEKDLVDYWAALKNIGVDETKLLEVAKQNKKMQPHVLDFILAKDKAAYVLDLYDKWIVNNPEFPQRGDVSHILRSAVKEGKRVLLEGPQAYFLSNSTEKFWDSGTSAQTNAAGILAASQINPQGLNVAIINIHKTPGSTRGGFAGACATSFLPQEHFSSIKATADDFKAMQLDWRDVSQKYFKTVQTNGLVKPALYSNTTGEYDLGTAMAAASVIHPTHKEFGVTTGNPRIVGFFDCVAHAEVMAAQGPYCSISALDRGDDYDEYGVCIAYVFRHPEGKSMVCNGRTFASGTIIRAGEQLPTQAILYHCYPIVKVVRGWRDTPLYARGAWWKERKQPADLPAPVCEMLDIIEHFTGSKVVSIGNGPKGGDIIYIERS